MRYSLTALSAPAVRAFAEAAGRALPVRDAGEPRPDGAALVSVEPVRRPTADPRSRLWWTGGGVLAPTACAPGWARGSGPP
ncbi:hypothetical protein ACIHEJ_28140 [Streptomyces sp. NPDC052301]|uniref:hypothetical protein n=1 Tax=Streptomyces sp. NPDC052301 TaxID=3365687 RepID=UPI0037D8B42E